MRRGRGRASVCAEEEAAVPVGAPPLLSHLVAPGSLWLPSIYGTVESVMVGGCVVLWP